MTTLNLGILAHVDAGKTSLTERLLHAAGVIDTIGSVDHGDTQTDTLELERQRGITIKSAVAAFTIGDVDVNLIDTPGHPDFIAEVERVLSVLDGAVLVVSAVEGVQAQTRVLMRTLQRLRIPTVIFANKIDRVGAQYESLLRRMTEMFATTVVPMGTVSGLGTRVAAFVPTGDEPGGPVPLLESLAEHDDTLLDAYVNETRVPVSRLRDELAAQTRHVRAHPVFFGSAITGAGVDALMAGLAELLPTPPDVAGEPLSGTVFKVDRSASGERIAYLRMFSGTLRTRDRVIVGEGDVRTVTAIDVFGDVFNDGTITSNHTVSAGQIATVHGLGAVRIGDTIGTTRGGTPQRYFAPPTFETVISARNPADKPALLNALSLLAEQDPLINLRQDDIRHEISLSLYGEVQKEVIQATLASQFGLDVVFRETTVVCIERPTGSGAAAEIISVEPNPFLATVGLRVDPAPIGSGVTFQLEVELGSMPSSFMKAVEDTVMRWLNEGLHGWLVTDCTITLTHSGYYPRQSHMHAVFDKNMSSTSADFRGLTPLVLMDALSRAGTIVCEPIHGFRLEAPADLVGIVLPALARVGAVPRATSVLGTSCVVEGDIPAARVNGLTKQVPSLTRGEGVFESAFARYDPVRGVAPSRPRSTLDPLNRKAYLLRV